MKKRSSGVLLHISSLPGPFGVGTFGEEATHFIDFIKNMGFSNWQVLPLGPLDAGNSPYASDSAFAGNIILIDPRRLFDDGLITKEELGDNFYNGSPYTADYAFAKSARLRTLKSAFLSMTDEMRDELESFCLKKPWVRDYALYLAIKDIKNGAHWWEWGELSDFSFADKHRQEFDTKFYEFCQFIFFSQWEELKKHANSRGVEIIGDMPIYVAPDSCDVWANRKLFCLDLKTFTPTKVAGVPPDYFSEDGQLWGNPIYNWKAMEKDGFGWWISRIKAALEMYDTVRIDHFRGMASYWAVPAEAKSAKEGRWEKGPGKRLFRAIFKAIDSPSVIAEDLGVYGDDVTELLDYTGFPGMRVIQFAFEDENDFDCVHLPHNYPKNTVAYIGTHDNNTLLGWLWETDEKKRSFALDYCGFRRGNWGEGGRYAPACRSIIEAVWRSAADTAVIALQDMCGFGADTRMNIPGVPDKNWRYRAAGDTFDYIDCEYFKRINKIFGRG